MTRERYDPTVIEPQWQRAWDEAQVFRVAEDPTKKKYYLLEILPYPSGDLHMGHTRNYSIADLVARYHWMRGENVLHPMGWDAFGLPAENAAIERGIHPAQWTERNIDGMKRQLKRLGYSYDWQREFATCDPDYYRWEQQIFLKMFEKGWAYQKKSPVNWCPRCETVLANEQAEGGTCWRCDASVEMKAMTQWYFRITDYAEELLRDIDRLTGWPERIRTIQRAWIGKSEGVTIQFPLEGSSETISVFTTRADTLFGVTFVSLACDHPLVHALAQAHGQGKEVEAFMARARRISHDERLADSFEKAGVWTGASCLHPFTRERIPIYAANFVLMEYGTGAVMAVPAHDQRDFAFAKKYKLPIKVVVQAEKKLDPQNMTEAFIDEGTLVNSGAFTGQSSAAAKTAIGAELARRGLGGSTIQYRLRDWCISRQRYWGAPIPIVYCESCGTVPVPEQDLPVVLPRDAAFTGKGGSPLVQVQTFAQTTCPQCNRRSRRETDTMDTFVESSWYFLRYTSPDYKKGPFDPAKVKYWLPIDQYIGGAEHAAGHLIYFRYFTKVLRDLGLTTLDEPALRLVNQGMVVKDGMKMSKSKGNVVSIDAIVDRYGADTARLFILFAAPPEKDLVWSDQGAEGSFRFLQRVWRLVQEWSEKSGSLEPRPQDDMLRMQHHTIKRVTTDMDRWHFNTAISAMMEYVNFLCTLKVEEIPRAAIETLIILLAPFAPHIAEELWQATGHKKFVVREAWPTFDPQWLTTDTMQIVVQVNGKLRERIVVASDADEATVKAAALGAAKVIPHLKGAAPKKILYVPKRLINIVV